MTTKCATQKPHRKVPQFKSRNTTVWIILGLGHYLSEIIDLFFVAFFHKWRHAQLFIIFIYIDIFVIHYYIWHKCKVIPSEEISDPVVFVFNFRCSKSWTYAAIFGLYSMYERNWPPAQKYAVNNKSKIFPQFWWQFAKMIILWEGLFAKVP